MRVGDSWVYPPHEHGLDEITRLDDSILALEKATVQSPRGKPKISSQDTNRVGGWRSRGKGSGFELVLSHWGKGQR